MWRIFGLNFSKKQEDANIIINSAPQQQRQGWNQQQRSTYQGKYPGNYYNSSNPKQPSLRDLILEHVRFNKSISKRLAFNDKVLENINTKLDSFSSAMKDQLSYNKNIES
jgi:predicted flavoprotein YhiN